MSYTCMCFGAIVVLPVVILIRVIAPIYRIRFGYFIADRILAKHDANYMPPEVSAALGQDKD